MKYAFTFSEINHGYIEMEASYMPDNSKIIEKVLEGEANYHNTDFTDFSLVDVNDKIQDNRL